MTREQILAAVKPILFNTEMVQALLDDHKHVTRRVVKPQPGVDGLKYCYASSRKADIGKWHGVGKNWMPPYYPGDLLYVRETWQAVYETEYEPTVPEGCVNIRTRILNFDAVPKVEVGISTEDLCRVMEPHMKYYVFKASNIEYADPAKTLIWHPSIHMPKEAARIFLRVKNVWPEKLQDITEEQAKAEGAFRAMEYNCPEGPVIYEDKSGYYIVGFKSIWNACYASPRAVVDRGVITHYESYPWEDIHETRTYKGLPWYVYGNPWVWANEFERVVAE